MGQLRAHYHRFSVYHRMPVLWHALIVLATVSCIVAFALGTGSHYFIWFLSWGGFSLLGGLLWQYYESTHCTNPDCPTRILSRLNERTCQKTMEG